MDFAVEKEKLLDSATGYVGKGLTVQMKRGYWTFNKWVTFKLNSILGALGWRWWWFGYKCLCFVRIGERGEGSQMEIWKGQE